jgi:ubiquinone/menaquinone biosynthesis C-methylase UbiE
MKTEDRFTSRVEDYIKYRPHYPNEVYSALLKAEVITPTSVIADIGCGTGISSELFLKHNHNTFGIEPNKAMLKAAKNYLKSYPSFVPILASAENTSLKERSVDAIICAQAFHWFNNDKSKKEFERIIKPNANVVLIWNDRKTADSGFQKVYEDFLRMFGTDYKIVDHKQVQKTGVLENFFSAPYTELTFPNAQHLDFEGLKGRIHSSSYMPEEGHADYDFMMYCLKKIFNRYEENGKITLEYETKIYYGTI